MGAPMRYQPQGLARVKGPLAAGLRAAVIPGLPDAVTGTTANQIYGTTGIDVIQAGRAWTFNTSAIEFSSVSYQAPPFTALVVVKKSSTVSESLITFGGSSSGYGWKIGSGGAADTFRLTYGGVADYNIVTGFWDIAGGVTVAVLVVQGTSAKLYKGGKLIASATVGTPKIPSKPLTLGAAFNSSNYTDLSSSSIAAAAVWGRALSDVEAARLSINPWQLFDSGSSGSAYQAAIATTAGPATPKSYTLTASAGSFGLSGASARLVAGRRLTASHGAFGLAGSGATLRAARRLSAATGVLSLAGSPAAILARRRLNANTGSFALSGAESLLKASRRLQAGTGQFSLIGMAASMRATRRLVAGSGAFVLSGASVDMAYTPATGPSGPTYTLSVAGGAFGLVGTDATLRVHRRLAASSGAFALTGPDVQLIAGRRLVASSGAFVITGAACALTAARRLTAQAGTFSLTGANAQLRYSGQVTNGLQPNPFRTYSPQSRIRAYWARERTRQL